MLNYQINRFAYVFFSRRCRCIFHPSPLITSSRSTASIRLPPSAHRRPWPSLTQFGHRRWWNGRDPRASEAHFEPSRRGVDLPGRPWRRRPGKDAVSQLGLAASADVGRETALPRGSGFLFWKTERVSVSTKQFKVELGFWVSIVNFHESFVWVSILTTRYNV